MVKCARLVKVIETNDYCQVSAKPDAAIRASDVNIVAMMELQLKENDKELFSADMGKCVLFSSMSALDFRNRAGFEKNIVIPFVLGHETHAFLYATCLDKGKAVPEVKKVGTYNVQITAGRVDFLATFASLLKLSMDMLLTCEKNVH
jgi:hypothetical protein